jgi:hypothetical protein
MILLCEIKKVRDEGMCVFVLFCFAAEVSCWIQPATQATYKSIGVFEISFVIISKLPERDH